MPKIIDEKGRLFGRVNIIDFLVFASMLCLIPIFYFSWRASVDNPLKDPATVVTPGEIVLELADYEKEIVRLEEVIIERDRKRDNFFREHKRLRKYWK